MARTSKLLVHPKEMVLTALRNAPAPLTAYDLLHQLEPFGVKSAPIVYRALSALEGAGSIHKIKELGAYVACNCADDHVHHLSVLTVCNQCKAVNELHNHDVMDHLLELKKLGINLPDAAVIELPILCETCRGVEKH
jgi:Fur family zinc uptake transcriptional regulator